MSISPNAPACVLSIGILAWNEEASIGPMLTSLFGQTIFRRLAARWECAEIVCLANGCSDGTAEVAREVIARRKRERPGSSGWGARVAEIREAGRNNAWNRFVHEFSAREAKFICVMDADILFTQPDTLELVLGELERNPHLGGASDWPVKRLGRNGRMSWRDRLSRATSDMTGTIPGRLNGMLYCLRADLARNLYLPRDLVANDDGFFKAAICTDFFRAPMDPGKVVSVRGATHLYQPYLTAREVIDNQKRQMIGQTVVHVAVDYLRTRPAAERGALAATLRRYEERDPDWLRKLIDAHVARTRFFWRLFPDVLTFRWRRWAQMTGVRRVTHLPAALAGFAITLVACWRAARFLRRGVTNYWPRALRQAGLMAPPAAAK